MSSKPPAFLLPVMIFSQFAGTSLWFAGNAIISEIQQNPNNAAGLANITSIVQFGFITGTLVFSLLTIADRFSASKVFFLSSILAAISNLLLVWIAGDTTLLYILRFITGFFLAGIYPVGMKIAADWFPGKLGNALGFLVGALVLGTAFPHILKSDMQNLPWKEVLIYTSILAVTGGLLILAVVPKTKNKLTVLKPGAITAFRVFQSRNFRSAAFGYFGHMWELYTFWAFLPFLLASYNETRQQNLGVALWSFLIIAAGCLGCIGGGLISQKKGSKKVAFYSLFVSGVCCLLSPWIFHLPIIPFLAVLLIWGITVVSDSPQFSSLVAQSTSPETKGTALTIVTSIGFSITIISVQFLKVAIDAFKLNGFLFLFIGPLLGLLALRSFREKGSFIS